MKINKRLINKSRRYSEEFKRKIVSDYESGKYSVLQLEKLHGVGNPTIYQWIYRFYIIYEKGYRITEMEKTRAVNIPIKVILLC